MHFHQHRPGTRAILRQYASRTLDYVLFEALDVDLDYVDWPSGQRVVERNHRDCDRTAASVGTRFDPRLESSRRRKAHLPVALTNCGSDHSHSVFPAVDADIGFQS